MKINNKYICFFISALFSGFLSSCVYDTLEVNDPNEDPIVSEDTYALSFQLSLPSMGRASASGFEAYEDYINTGNLRLLFFYNDGEEKTYYELTNPTQEETETQAETQEIIKNTLIREYSSSATSQDKLQFIPVQSTLSEAKWTVRIIIDEKDADDMKFADAIRNHDFKIAVLANWPGSLPTPALNPGDHIDKLHHLVDDDQYYKDDKLSTYDFLLDKNKYSGANLSWYDARLKTAKDESADDWIRTNWNPSLSMNPKLLETEDANKYQYPELGRYSDLWFLWNFGGNASDSALPYSTYSAEWTERNGNHLLGWVTEKNTTTGYDAEVKIRTLKEHKESSTEDDSDFDPADTNFLSFTEAESARAVKTPDPDNAGKYYYGVRIPRATLKDGKVSKDTPGVFSFEARAVGNLYITAKGVGSSNSTLKVQIGESSSSVETITVNAGVISTNKGKKINITGDEQRVYIYSNNNNDVEIYQIEFVQGLYLDYTARQGRTPDNQNIPMYGVQSYAKLGEVWKPGSIFNLSVKPDASSTYDTSDIYLLRSVAKIELFVPISMKPCHVYLRSVNASVRCEPLDVSTDTWDIWNPKGTPDHNATNPDQTCEFFNIMGHKPFYQASYSGDQQTEYKKRLAWYYGNWREPNTNTIKGYVNQDVPSDGEYNGTSNPDDYPRIMNPRIVRSDFVEFIRDESYNEGGFYRYVLYVGEKFVDDPNSVGGDMITDTPKVCHIEFRTESDLITNYDDDHCYRIYFTDGGYQKGDVIPKFADGDDTWEKKYEQNVNNLQKHWPIIRNHWYSFRVNEANARYLSVDVKVLAWAKRDITVTW